MISNIVGHFKLSTLVVAVMLVGCSPPQTPTTSMSDSPEKRLIPVQAGDSEFEAAMKEARDRFPEFWQLLSDDYKRPIPVYVGAVVKVYFSDPEEQDTGEHMWVNQIDYDGKMISGTLVDTPRFVRSVKSGQRVIFPLERLSDWFYVENGKAMGAFTAKLLRKRMTPEERREHDSHYPFSFD